MTNEEQAALQWDVLGHEGLGLTEIRKFNPSTRAWLQNKSELQYTLMQHGDSDLYIGINPRRKEGGKTEDVSHITAVVFDFDPVRPSGRAASDEQQKRAIALAGSLADKEHGILVSSGNGAHVYLPVVPLEVKDPVDTARKIRSFGDAYRKDLSTTDIKVDTIFDLPRVIRVWGSINSKSGRRCEYLSGKIERRPLVLPELKTNSVEFVDNGVTARYERLLQTSGLLKHIASGNRLFPSRSESDFAFARELVKSGFSETDLALLLPRNSGGKASDRSEQGLKEEAKRLYAKLYQECGVHSIGADLRNYVRDLDNRRPGISTGFERWDKMTAGLKPGRLYVTAGRPTEGKTTYLTQTAVSVARSGRRVTIFPTEVPAVSIWDKIISSLSRVSLSKFQFGDFSSEEKASVQAAANEAQTLPIFVIEDFSLTVEEVIENTERLSPDLVIVDFLQCMRYNDPNSSSELARNVVEIKALGKRKNIPIILSSQLHRKPADVPDSLSDLKGTGKLEEEGDVITFIRTVDTNQYPVHSRATILKNKYGQPGEIDMLFHRSECRFEEKQ